MATSILRFYRTEITPERNAWVEDMHEYLEKHAVKTYEDLTFQYQKISINKVINVMADQEKVGDQSLGNYCEIIQDNRSYFFFITDVDWASKMAVKVGLSLDTLNTFGEDLEFASQTTIVRQHGNRFLGISARDKYPATRTLVRTIDRQPENIVLQKELQYSEKIEDVASEGINWFLIYKTRDNLTPDNTANPIECDLIADAPLLVKKGHGELPPLETLPTFYEANEFYYFDPINNPNGEFTYTPSLGETKTIKLGDASGDTTEIIVLQVVNGEIAISGIVYDKNGPYWEPREGTKGYGGAKKIVYKQATELVKLSAKIKSFNDIINGNLRKPVESGTKEDATTMPFKDLDKTNSKLMKIIRLPYCPFNIVKNDLGELQVPVEWEYTNKVFKLKNNDLSKEFENLVGTEDLTSVFVIRADVSPAGVRDTYLESKMYNSEFYTHKYVYDSFTKEIKLENFKIADYTSGNKVQLPITFKPTNTVNSKFAFKFDTNCAYNLDHDINYENESDYEDYLIVDRNNEETIFSNDYINYIRNGYNYDKKAKKIALAQGIGGIILGGLQAGATFGLGKYSETPMLTKAEKHHNLKLAARAQKPVTPHVPYEMSPLLSAAAISAGFNAVNGLVSTISGQIQAQQAIEQKLQQLSSQSTNVRGADDVDLLQYYNGNKLELKNYVLPELAEKNINNLFYYAGYAHQVQELPKLDSRYWFNYLQCTPIFKNEQTSVYSDYLDDIKVRFENGVTKYHHHPELRDGWDISQEKENWETDILDTSTLPTTKIAGTGIEDFTVDINTKEATWRTVGVPPKGLPLEFRYVATDGFERTARTATSTASRIILTDYDGNSNIYVKRIDTWNELLNSDEERVW